MRRLGGGRTGRWVLALVGVVALLTVAAWAHVGTGSVYVQGKAGPYPVYVSVTPPVTIPGEATVVVVCDAPGVESVTVQANVLGGAGGATMPAPWILRPGPAGTHEFTGTAWIMTEGSWQVRVRVAGAAGTGSLAVPLAASPTRLLPMSKPFAAWLILGGLAMLAGLGALAFAAAGQAGAAPGSEPTSDDRRRGRKGVVVVLTLTVVFLLAAFALWRQQVSRYRSLIYTPLQMATAVRGEGVLHLTLTAPAAAPDELTERRLDDLVPDHEHLMHAYLVRWPAMDVVFHLHPQQAGVGVFNLPLPAVPAGDYKVFADVVHADGFPETAVGDVQLDRPEGRALAGDDARGDLRGVGSGGTIDLGDGYRFEFAPVSPLGQTVAEIRVQQPVVLRFTLLDAAGHAPAAMENYMGMVGHLAVIGEDGKVFAHVHPEGSASMAAYMLANPGAGMASGAVGNVAAFPFGFPASGRYRLIVQMKHDGRVETKAVDVRVR